MNFVYTAAAEAGKVISSAVTDIDFTPIYSEIVSLIPVLIPVVISVLAIKKGLGFFLGMLRGL